MRTRFAGTRAALAQGVVVIALAAGITSVRADQDLLLRAPFDFRAGAARFGPGEYLVEVRGAGADASGTVTVRTADRKRRASVPASRSRESATRTGRETPIVSFRSYGDSRFLSAIEVEDGSERWDVAPSAEEGGLARQGGQPTVTSLKAETIKKP